MEVSEVLNPYTHMVLFSLVLPLYVFVYLLAAPKSWLKQGEWIATFSMFIAFFMAAYLLAKCWNSPTQWFHIPWVTLGIQTYFVGILIGKVQLVMAVLVTFISFLVHLYSISYMQGDTYFHRYFAYLNLFTFSMLVLVFSDNLLQMFIGWELVGFSSYVLIGFWQYRELAGKAAQKAFILNRIGDLGFVMALGLVHVYAKTWDFPMLWDLFQQSHWEGSTLLLGKTAMPWWAFHAIGFGFLMACIGKSAQFPLQVWLPDAMQGPTPVSALIHAATMVAAGVFLLFQCFPMLSPEILMVVICIGCITAFMGAYAASGQLDIKKILAFSTVSQLGFMVMAIGAGAPEKGMFHLSTHAFFKAALFLGAGSIIHAFHHTLHQLQHAGLHIHFNPQHINVMGGLRKKLPFTAAIYLIATWGAAGLPLSSGFLSKDDILSSLLAWASIQQEIWGIWIWVVPIMAFITSFFTAYYMSRQFILIFLGSSRLESFIKRHYSDTFNIQSAAGQKLKQLLHVEESSKFMQISMGALAIFTFWIFFSYHPLDTQDAWLPKGLAQSIHQHLSMAQLETKIALDGQTHHFHSTALVLSVSMIVFGFLSAYILHLGPLRLHWYKGKTAFFNQNSWINQWAVNHFFMDRLYKDFLAPRAVQWARFCSRLDRAWDSTIQGMAIGTVLFSYFISWFDRRLVDGLALAPAWTSRTIGRGIQMVQKSSWQVLILLAFVLTGFGILWISFG